MILINYLNLLLVFRMRTDVRLQSKLPYSWDMCQLVPVVLIMLVLLCNQ
jgi:hypothetical protein